MSSPASNLSIQIPPKIAPLNCKTTARHPSFWKNAQEYFSEYMNVTTLNSFRYLGERNREKFENILWLVIINVSLGTCSFLILETYRKWDNTPVIVTFAHSPMLVWKVPIPASTICPETKWRQSVYNFTQYYDLYENNKEELSDSELKFLGDASLLCQLKIEGNLTTDKTYCCVMFIIPHVFMSNVGDAPGHDRGRSCKYSPISTPPRAVTPDIRLYSPCTESWVIQKFKELFDDYSDNEELEQGHLKRINLPIGPAPQFAIPVRVTNRLATAVQPAASTSAAARKPTCKNLAMRDKYGRKKKIILKMPNSEKKIRLKKEDAVKMGLLA